MNDSHFSLVAFYRVVLACLALVTGGSLFAERLAAETPPGESLAILLDNGEVLWGQLERLPGKYRVHTSQGSSLILDRKRVTQTARSLERLYAYQQQRIGPADARGHTKLGEWALTQDLIEQAGDEAAAALRIDPSSPDAQQLQRRLDTLRESAPSMTLATTSIQPNNTPPKHNRFDGQVSVTVTGENLGQSEQARELLIHSFTTQIQPHLMRSCATFFCHGHGGRTSFSLLRPVRNRGTDRELTLANLRSVLSETSSSAEETAQFLDHAFRAHGGISKSPLDRDSIAAKQLQLFVTTWSGRVRWEDATEPTREGPMATSRQQLLEQSTRTGDPFDPGEFNHESADK